MKNIRLSVVVLLFVLLFVVIIGRLFYWQVISGEEMVILAEKQHFETLDLPASRGKILDRDKNPLVTNEIAFLLYANAKNIIRPKKEIADLLAPILKNDYELEKINSDQERQQMKNEKEKIESLLGTPNTFWVPLAHKVSLSEKEEIEKLKIEGLGFENEEKRFYPEGSISAHLLGFVGKDTNGEDMGYFGLEGYHDRELKGKSGSLKQEKDALGRPIILGEQDIEKPRPGRTLVTTIDKVIQAFSEKYLKEGIEQFGAKGGTVIVANPNNGAILAMSSFPSYDPAQFDRYENDWFKNPAVGETFEPGSIIKPIIMSVAIQEGKVKPTTHCPKCNGPRQIGEYTIRTFNDQYHPNITMTEVLENSDNTGMVYIGELIGKKNLYEYLQKYGFGKVTGIDLQEEEEGRIKPLDEWYPIDAATMTFGQGIAVTQIQMVRAYSALANGGILIKPFVVQKIIDQGKEIDVSPKDTKRVIDKEVSKVISEMLVSVTAKSPLHFPKDRIPQLAKYRIAAKSGTAQIPLSGHYDPTKTIASVIGFAPTENPKFVVLVRLVEPSARPWGSDTAGPIFFNIVRDLLTYYGINPRP